MEHLKKTLPGRPASDTPIADALDDPIPTPDPPQDQAREMPAAIVGLTIVCRCGQPQIIPVDMSGKNPPVLQCECKRIFQVQSVRIGFGEAEPAQPKPAIYLPPNAGSVVPFPGRVR